MAADRQAPATRRRAILVKMGEPVRLELDVLAAARNKTVQELGLEALCDLLRKYGRPVDLRDALRKSAGVGPQDALPESSGAAKGKPERNRGPKPVEKAQRKRPAIKR
jgi:hypothetical protein